MFFQLGCDCTVRVVLPVPRTVCITVVAKVTPPVTSLSTSPESFAGAHETREARNGKLIDIIHTVPAKAGTRGFVTRRIGWCFGQPIGLQRCGVRDKQKASDVHDARHASENASGETRTSHGHLQPAWLSGQGSQGRQK